MGTKVNYYFIASAMALALGLGVLIGGCSPGSETINADMQTLDKDLAGCKSMRVTFNSSGSWGYVVRCPAMDSVSTTYPVGKSRQSTTVLSEPADADKQKQIDEIMKQLDALSTAVGKLK